jgi:predicted  nucleic acid-binding Zn-ribbon protein
MSESSADLRVIATHGKKIEAELRRPTPDSGYIRKWHREIDFARKSVRKLSEQVEMLRGAEKTVKKALALNPRSEESWDQVSEHAADLSMAGIRSTIIVEEIDDLINKLPED